MAPVGTDFRRVLRPGWMKASATAHQVARLAQVSQSAVSRAFTPGASVSDTTRAKVLAAARTLGYRPNALARSLITRKSGIVALVMSYLQNQFYPLVIEQLSQALQRRGLHVLMFISDESNANGVLEEILQYQVDGIVMASTTLSPELARQCADVGIPIVLFNRVPALGTTQANDSTSSVTSDNHSTTLSPELARQCADVGIPIVLFNRVPALGTTQANDSTSSVTSDNHGGGQLVAELLMSRGFERIAFLAGLENSSTSIERERGFNEALHAAGRKVHARAAGQYDFACAKLATRGLFECPDPQRRPDALFVANDHMAIAVLDVLRIELGLRVPQDVSVVGFDDVPQADWGAYRLTTVMQEVPAMVAATVGLLDEQMRAEQPVARSVVVPCRLIERDTVVTAEGAAARASAAAAT